MQGNGVATKPPETVGPGSMSPRGAKRRAAWGGAPPNSLRRGGAARAAPLDRREQLLAARAGVARARNLGLPQLSSETPRLRAVGQGPGAGTFTGRDALTRSRVSCRGRALILGEKQSACGLKPATPQARSSVVEHYLDTVGVGSSILPAPTKAAVSVLNLRSLGLSLAGPRGFGPERLPL